MLTLARRQKIYLPPPRRERPGVLAANTEQNKFSDVAEVKAHTASVRAAVFSYLVPDDVGLVCEAPSLHDSETIRQHCVRTPKIEMRCRRGDVRHGQCADLVELHSAVAR